MVGAGGDIATTPNETAANKMVVSIRDSMIDLLFLRAWYSMAVFGAIKNPGTNTWVLTLVDI